MEDLNGLSFLLLPSLILFHFCLAHNSLTCLRRFWNTIWQDETAETADTFIIFYESNQFEFTLYLHLAIHAIFYAILTLLANCQLASHLLYMDCFVRTKLFSQYYFVLPISHMTLFHRSVGYIFIFVIKVCPINIRAYRQSSTKLHIDSLLGQFLGITSETSR